MSYLHIDNLYKSQDILLFKECWALEKVHGTSAHVSWHNREVSFFSGGEKPDKFKALFDEEFLKARFLESVGDQKTTVYGEAYGGKCQGMSSTYGKELQFICFDVRIGDSWLAVPNMADFCRGLGLEVVPHRKILATLEYMDIERDFPSEVAYLRGCGTDRLREGIVIRPLIEVTKSNGARIIAKHKAETFSERATPQKVVNPDKLTVLADAKAVAEEWVTEMRLTHILDKMPGAGIEQTGDVIRAMIEDVYREGKGEIVEGKDVGRAIGSKAAEMFKRRIKEAFRAGAVEA